MRNLQHTCNKFLELTLGAILGILLEEELKDIAFYFFAALSGIFLYISLASLFPVLQDMIDDQVIIGNIPVCWQ